MKIKRFFGAVWSLFLMVSLSACAGRTEIVLPEPKSISAIETIVNDSQEGRKISDQNEIVKLIDSLKTNAKPTDKESVNDQPTNVEKYTIIKFHHTVSQGNISVVYVYKKDGKIYAEQPYSGIWELKE